MKVLLEEINRAVNDSDTVRCTPDETQRKGKIGRVKRSNKRYEDDVLRFMDNKIVPFTNTLSENGIRITKVQQKISGCFRSIEGSKIFCRIRDYLSTCRMQGVTPARLLIYYFRGNYLILLTDIFTV